jgi:hypothetical protein
MQPPWSPSLYLLFLAKPTRIFQLRNLKVSWLKAWPMAVMHILQIHPAWATRSKVKSSEGSNQGW